MTPEPDQRSPLSDTELEIMRLVATGATNREIARARTISEATVKKHLTNINGKLGTGNRTEALRRALELGIVSIQGPMPSLVEDDDGPEGDADGSARQLAEQLARERARHRRQRRWYLGLAVAALALATGTWLRSTPLTPAVPTAVPDLPGRASDIVPQLHWSPGGRLRTPRAGLAIAYADGLYAIGGEDEGGVLNQTLRLQRSLVASWTELAPKPAAVRDIAALVVGGQIVVPGGCDSSGRPTRQVDIYDTEQQRWLGGPALPRALCAYGSAVVNGRIYLFGGREGPDAASASDAVWSWSPVQAQDEGWRAEPRMARPRYDLAAAAVEDVVHVLGGRDAEGQANRNHWVFQPLNDRAPWSEDQGLQLPEARAGHTAVGVGLLRRIYVFGGADAVDAHEVISLELSAASAWRAGPRILVMPPRRSAAALYREESGEIWLAGGNDAEGKFLNQTLFLNLGQALLGGPQAGP